MVGKSHQLVLVTTHMEGRSGILVGGALNLQSVQGHISIAAYRGKPFRGHIRVLHLREVARESSMRVFVLEICYLAATVKEGEASTRAERAGPVVLGCEARKFERVV